jgi:hypothetical protein
MEDRISWLRFFVGVYCSFRQTLGWYLRTSLPSLLMPLYYITIIISVSTVLVRTLTASHWRFRNLIMTLGRTPLDKWSAHHEGLYLHRTTQHRNTKANIHASSGIQTHDSSNQVDDLRLRPHGHRNWPVLPHCT